MRQRGIVDQAGLDDHVLGVALEIDAENPRRLERDHAIPGVVSIAPVVVVDGHGDRLADDRGQVVLDSRTDAGIAAEGDRRGMGGVESDRAVGKLGELAGVIP